MNANVTNDRGGNLTQEIECSPSDEFVEGGISMLDDLENQQMSGTGTSSYARASRKRTSVSISPSSSSLRSPTNSSNPPSKKSRTGAETETTAHKTSDVLKRKKTCVVNTGLKVQRPTHGRSPKYTRHKKHVTEDMIQRDPRGLPSQRDLPSLGYCSACRCPYERCHEVIFGEFCELAIVTEVEDANWYITDDYVDKIFVSKYSDALQFKVHEVMGAYDKRKGGFQLPRCMETCSYSRSLQYTNFHTYHYSKYDKLEQGHNDADTNRNHLFERQLVVDGMYTAMMSEVGEDEDAQEEHQE